MRTARADRAAPALLQSRSRGQFVTAPSLLCNPLNQGRCFHNTEKHWEKEKTPRPGREQSLHEHNEGDSGLPRHLSCKVFAEDDPNEKPTVLDREVTVDAFLDYDPSIIQVLSS